MESILSQRSQPHNNTPIGTSKYLIHACGSAITLLAEIMELTPLEVNKKLTENDAFSPDSTGEKTQVIWDKIMVAFPGWSAQFIEPYNNETVLDSLSKGRFVIVLTESAYAVTGLFHAVRYIGGGKCHDPFSGEEKPTSDFPHVKSFVVLTKVEQPKAVVFPPIEAAPIEEENDQNDEVIPTPTGTEITLANLPVHEKKAILKQLRIIKRASVEIKKLLGV